MRILGSGLSKFRARDRDLESGREIRNYLSFGPTKVGTERHVDAFHVRWKSVAFGYEHHRAWCSYRYCTGSPMYIQYSLPTAILCYSHTVYWVDSIMLYSRSTGSTKQMKLVCKFKVSSYCTAYSISSLTSKSSAVRFIADGRMCGFRTTAGWWNDLMVETFAYVWHVGSYFKLSTFHACWTLIGQK